jgi:small subunit ribosomal protein S16
VATKIRLTRLGGHKRPYYRIVVISDRTARDGQAIETLGYYDPLVTGADRVKINAERLKDWLGKGAKPSETVRQIIKKLPAGA